MSWNLQSFYLNFSEITEMQEIVDNWNQATEEMVQEQKREPIHSYQ